MKIEIVGLILLLAVFSFHINYFVSNCIIILFTQYESSIFFKCYKFTKTIVLHISFYCILYSLLNG